MDFNELCIKVKELINHAKVANHLCNYEEAYKHLGNAYDLLNEEVGSGARDKCESSESSNREIDVVDLQEGDKYHDL